MLENISLFPEMRYLRFRGDYQLDHKSGGLISLLLIGIMILILFLKLNEMFQMTSVFHTHETSVRKQPEMTILSTYQNQTINSPYMVGVNWASNGACSYAPSIQAYHYIQTHNTTTNTNSYDWIPISLETCTTEHFSKIPNIESNSYLPNLKCLPLNQQYQIGGQVLNNNIFKAVVISVRCNSACGSSCGYMQIYQPNNQVNPNNEQPFQQYIETRYADLDLSYYNYYTNQLDKKTMNTDASLFPFQQKKYTSTMLGSSVFQKQFGVQDPSSSQTNIWFIRSSVTHTYNRNYLTLIDVFSYVGGLFPALFALFFFMRYFGIFFYESTFAYLHFNDRSVRENHFGIYIKQVLYGVFVMMGMNPDRWKICQRQRNILKTVNKMLDINYLYRRIDYLERAIQVLLDQHQLKGIYLTKVSVRQADEHFKRHRLRDKVIRCLYHRSEQVMEDQKKHSKGHNEQGTDKGKMDSIEMINKNHLSGQMMANQRQIVQQHRDKNSSRRSALKKTDHQIDKRHKMLKLWERHYILSKQVQGTDLAGQKLTEAELQREVNREVSENLRKLFDEAEIKGDPVSKRIVENIDQWLRNQLKMAIDDQVYTQSPVVEIQLMTNKKIAPEK